MPPPVTANSVLAELRRHIDECGTLNRVTAEALVNMTASHRDLVAETAKMRVDFTGRWDKFNTTAWKAVGAVAMTMLAGIIGVVAQNYNLANTAVEKAAQVAATPTAGQAQRDARQQQILNELADIKRRVGG